MLTAMASSRPDPIFAVLTFLESCIGRVHDGELKKVSTNVHFNIDNMIGFYPIYGFISCLGLIIIAKMFAMFFKKEDTYYDD